MHRPTSLATLSALNSISRSPWRLVLLLIPLTLACFTLSQTPRAALEPPAPDGPYRDANTAEGFHALFNLTTGSQNTSAGSTTLLSNPTSSHKTAIAAQT